MRPWIALALFLASPSHADHEIPSDIRPDSVYRSYQSRMRREGETFVDKALHPCEDMASAACAKTPPDDPTGSVKPALDTILDEQTYKKQKDALAEIVGRWAKLKDPKPPKRKYVIDEYVKKHKFTEKLDRIDKILAKVKVAVAAFVKKAAGTVAGAFVEEKLERVRLFRDFESEPSELFGNNMSMQSYETPPTISIGAERLLTVESEHNNFFILGHEIAHYLHAIGLREKFPVFGKVMTCIDKKFGSMKVGDRLVNQEEIWSDWIGQNVYFDGFLNDLKISDESKLEGMKNVPRLLCGYGGSRLGHPPNSFRANFFVGHQGLRKLACKGFTGKQREQPYCEVPI